MSAQFNPFETFNQEKCMEKFIVYIDNQQHALQQLTPMLTINDLHAACAHWILLACPPRLNRHTGRWLTQAAQKKWRQEWTQENTSGAVSLLEKFGHKVSVRTAHGALVELTKQVKGEVGEARVIDARRPKLDVTLAPVTQEQPQEKSNWALPGGVLVMSAAILLGTE